MKTDDLGRNISNPVRDPLVVQTFKGIRRMAAEEGRTEVYRKQPITRDILKMMLLTCKDEKLIDCRDRALLLFAWASGGRRASEAVSAHWSDLTETSDGYIYHLARSKTDQEGKGTDLVVVGTAAKELSEWMEKSGASLEDDGPIFVNIDRHGNMGRQMSVQGMRNMVKKRIKLCGLDPAKYSSHSLRSGFATQSAIDGVPAFQAMQLTGHKDFKQFSKYTRTGELMRNDAVYLFDR